MEFFSGVGNVDGESWKRERVERDYFKINAKAEKEERMQNGAWMWDVELVLF